MLQVTDLLTQKKVIVDDNKRVMTDFDNAKQLIYYSAPESNSETEHWVNYNENGIINNVEEKLLTYNNIIRINYASAVNFAASKNDPERKIWNKFVEYTKNHQDELFDKDGNWRTDATIGIDAKTFLE